MVHTEETYTTERNGFITTGDISTRTGYLQVLKAAKRGDLIRVRHGVYARPQALFNTMIDIERIVPGGVVCLYNAWAFYQLSTTVPPHICVAIETDRKVVLSKKVDIKLYYWKKENLDFGIVEQVVSGFEVRMTDIERSVCDAIKYRNKVGIDVCAEVVRNYLQRRDRDISKLMEYSQRLRTSATLKKYLEIALV